MPRRAEIPGQPATVVIQTRFTPADADLLDAARGKTGRSTWIRDLVRVAVATDPAASSEPDPVYPGRAHRHRPGKMLAERTVKGATTTTYRCVEEGCDAELERTR